MLLNFSAQRANYVYYYYYFVLGGGHCSCALEESVGTAVDDHRHGNVVHFAQAIFVTDFRDQVAARCPGRKPVPSLEWLQLRFLA